MSCAVILFRKKEIEEEKQRKCEKIEKTLHNSRIFEAYFCEKEKTKGEEREVLFL